jgi:hypothetical protein
LGEAHALRDILAVAAITFVAAATAVQYRAKNGNSAIGP